MIGRVKMLADPAHMQAAMIAGREYFAWQHLLLSHSKDFKLQRVAWNSERQCCDVLYTKPRGRLGESSYIAEAIARMIAVRSRRRDPETGLLRPVIDEWWRLTRLEFSPLFDRCIPSKHVGNGWVDMTLALADWLYDKESTAQIEDYESHDGDLVAEITGYSDRQFRIVEAFETLSHHVCEMCGAPGKNYAGDALRPGVTACDLHRNGEQSDES